MIANILTILAGARSVKLPPMPPTRKSQPRSRDHAALAQAVKVLIAEREHMTPKRVSDHSGGLSLNQVYAIERGEANPTYLKLLKLADGLHVSIGELMTRVDEFRDKPARRPQAGHRATSSSSSSARSMSSLSFMLSSAASLEIRAKGRGSSRPSSRAVSCQRGRPASSAKSAGSRYRSLHSSPIARAIPTLSVLSLSLG